MPLPFVPKNSADLHTWINRMQNRYKYRDRGTDLNLLRVIKAYYYATISFVDYQVGRVLETVDRMGQLDNTLIMFTSDHGEHLGDFNCFGKRSMHDASARVPLLVRFPSCFAPGKLCATAVSLVDVFPTLLGASGIADAGIDLDGVDLAEVARGATDRTNVYSQVGQKEEAIYMVVNEDLKYVYSAGDHREFLFDRRQDPRETKNLADAAKVRKDKDTMKRDLLSYLKGVNSGDAFVARGGSLDWRRYPRMKEDYLRDPDAKLLVQDYPSYPTHLPGYNVCDH